MNSQMFHLNLNDFWKGLIVLVLMTVINYLLKNIANLVIVDDPMTNQGIILTMSAVLGYLLKQLGTDSNGDTLGVKF